MYTHLRHSSLVSPRSGSVDLPKAKAKARPLEQAVLWPGAISRSSDQVRTIVAVVVASLSVDVEESMDLKGRRLAALS